MHVTWAWALVAPPDSTATAWLAFVHLLASFGVPLFLLVSARALLQGYHAALGGLRGWVAFVARRAQRLLPAYLAWSLLSLAAHDTSVFTSPLDLAGTLLLGGADIHFYFVPLVFQLYLLWPIFARAGRLSSKSTTATVLITVGATLLMIACWRVTPAWNHSPPLLQLLLGAELTLLVPGWPGRCLAAPYCHFSSAGCSPARLHQGGARWRLRDSPSAWSPSRWRLRW